MKRIHDLEVEEYIHDCVTIDRTPGAIKGEFIRVPGDMYYWSEKAAQAKRLLAEAKIELKRVTVLVTRDYRKKARSRGDKVTDKQVLLEVETDPDVEDAQLRVIECSDHKDRMVHILDAIQVKKNMLISLGAQIRAEMGHAPVILEPADQDHEEDLVCDQEAPYQIR